MSKKILVVDDEKSLLSMMKEMLAQKDADVLTSPDSEEAYEIFLKEKPSIIFCDYKMPKMNGIELMEKILEHNPLVAVVIITGMNDVHLAVEAMKKGAYDYILKPMDIGKILPLIDRISDAQNTLEEKKVFEDQIDQLFGFKNFVGNSEQIRHVYDQIKRVAASNSTVLITGESGTGKELVANALHYTSDRKGKPFIKVNCAALSEGLIESELFGHEKGAFTGAYERRLGRFEAADRGTILLDEVGTLSKAAQIKLLQVLQEPANACGIQYSAQNR